MSTMTTSVGRAGARDRAAASTAGRSAWVTAALLVVSVLLVGAAGWVAKPLLAGAPDDADNQLTVPGGTLRLTRVVPEYLAHTPGMPGQMMPQPVPAGFTRVSVEVTLVATGPGLTYDAADFRVSGPGVAAVKPQRDALGAGAVPEGARVDGELVFQVPEGAEGLVLGVRDVDGSIPLLVPAAPTHPGGTGHSG